MNVEAGSKWCSRLGSNLNSVWLCVQRSTAAVGLSLTEQRKSLAEL